MLTLSLLFKGDEISEVRLPNGKQPHISPHTTDHYEMEASLNTSAQIWDLYHKEYTVNCCVHICNMVNDLVYR